MTELHDPLIKELFASSVRMEESQTRIEKRLNNIEEKVAKLETQRSNVIGGFFTISVLSGVFAFVLTNISKLSSLFHIQ